MSLRYKICQGIIWGVLGNEKLPTYCRIELRIILLGRFLQDDSLQAKKSTLMT
jgi:hypothetical protein